MNIYVGNLSYRMGDGELREVFEAYGEVYRPKLYRTRCGVSGKGERPGLLSISFKLPKR